VADLTYTSSKLLRSDKIEDSGLTVLSWILRIIKSDVKQKFTPQVYVELLYKHFR
jgi:hypothetical protein